MGDGLERVPLATTCQFSFSFSERGVVGVDGVDGMRLDVAAGLKMGVVGGRNDVLRGEETVEAVAPVPLREVTGAGGLY